MNRLPVTPGARCVIVVCRNRPDLVGRFCTAIERGLIYGFWRVDIDGGGMMHERCLLVIDSDDDLRLSFEIERECEREHEGQAA